LDKRPNKAGSGSILNTGMFGDGCRGGCFAIIVLARKPEIRRIFLLSGIPLEKTAEK
jgi:hypothetical protein